MKIRPVEGELFHADGGTDIRTDMTKPIVAFRNFANVTNESFLREWRFQITCFFTSISAVSLVTELRAGRPRHRGSIPGRSKIFLFSKASRPAGGPAQPPI